MSFFIKGIINYKLLELFIVFRENIFYNRIQKGKGINMITSILTSAFDVAGAVIDGLGTLFGEVIGLVYDGTALTDFGTLVVLVAAVPLAWNILAYFIGLFKSATKIKGR